jgi:NAD(P)-dependent dehydrogenase (short-subunit alcohol dehydrogenase family)
MELAPCGVRVNAVAPGPTETPILERSGLSAADIAAVKKAEVARVPLGRRGTSEDVADWVVHLADNSASWVTGQVIAVDGGLSIA